MKKRVLFFSTVALIGAFMLSVQSCKKWKPEVDKIWVAIDELDDDVAKLKADVAKLEADMKALRVVSNVSYNSSTNVLTVTFTSGSPASTNLTLTHTHPEYVNPTIKYPVITDNGNSTVTIEFWDGTQARTFTFPYLPNTVTSITSIAVPYTGSGTISSISLPYHRNTGAAIVMNGNTLVALGTAANPTYATSPYGHAYLPIQVSPATADLTKYTLTLEGTDGTPHPVPIASVSKWNYTEYGNNIAPGYTRADANNGLWVVNLSWTGNVVRDWFRLDIDNNASTNPFKPDGTLPFDSKPTGLRLVIKAVSNVDATQVFYTKIGGLGETYSLELPNYSISPATFNGTGANAITNAGILRIPVSKSVDLWNYFIDGNTNNNVASNRVFSTSKRNQWLYIRDMDISGVDYAYSTTTGVTSWSETAADLAAVRAAVSLSGTNNMTVYANTTMVNKAVRFRINSETNNASFAIGASAGAPIKEVYILFIANP